MTLESDAHPTLTLREYENFSAMMKRIPKKQFTNRLQRVNVYLTDMDADEDFICFGTNTGDLIIYERSSDAMHKFTTKKFVSINCVKMERGIELCIAIGYGTSAMDMYIIPLEDKKPIISMVRIYPLSIHKSCITALCWSQNCQFLFSGDSMGIICCSTIENNEAQSYELEAENSAIVDLSYRYRRLLVASHDGFSIRSGTTFSTRTPIGKKARKKSMKLGATFLPSFCKEEMANLVACCPKNKLWLVRAFTCEVIQTYILHWNLLNCQKKDIPLLPDIISTRTITSEEVEFTNVSGMNDYLCVLWSEKGLAFMDVSESSTILGVSFRVGKIIRVRCTFSSGSESKAEIFVLREAVEGTNQFIRLATHPIVANKLIIGHKIPLPELVSGAGKEHADSVSSNIERRISVGQISTPVACSADIPRRGSTQSDTTTCMDTSNIVSNNTNHDSKEELRTRWENYFVEKPWSNDIKTAAKEAFQNIGAVLSKEQEGIETAVEAIDKLDGQVTPVDENAAPVQVTGPPTSSDPLNWFRDKFQNIQDTPVVMNLSNAVSGWKVWSKPHDSQQLHQISEISNGITADIKKPNDLLLAVEVSEVEEPVNVDPYIAREIDLDGDNTMTYSPMIKSTTPIPYLETAREIDLDNDNDDNSPVPCPVIHPVHVDVDIHSTHLMNNETSSIGEISSLAENDPIQYDNRSSQFNDLSEVKSISSMEPSIDNTSIEDVSSQISQGILDTSSLIASADMEVDETLIYTEERKDTSSSCDLLLPADLLESELFEQDNNRVPPSEETKCSYENKISLSLLTVTSPETLRKESSLENSISSSRSIASLRYATADVHPLSPSPSVHETISTVPPRVSSAISGRFEVSRRSSPIPYKMYLSGEMLSQCDHFSFHRCPFQCQCLCVTRNAIYAVDNRGKLFGCSLRTDASQEHKHEINIDMLELKWTTASTDAVLADSLHVSPCGSIAWRMYRSSVSVYQGMITSHTLIHDSSTPGSNKPTGSKRAALLASANQAMSKLRIHRRSDHKVQPTSPPLVGTPSSVKNVWNEVLHGIRCVDVDNHMGLYVTQNRGELKIHTGLRSGLPYHRSFLVNSPCPNIVDISCLNGIVWTLGISGSKKDQQQVLYAKYIEKWKQAVEPGNEDWHQVPISHTLLNVATRVMLGYQGTAWLCTNDNRWYFTIGITPTSPQGSGCWYQISLQRFLDLSTNDHSADPRLTAFSTSSNISFPRVQLSVKCSPAMGKHWMGALWLCCETRRTIAVCQSPILGHRWCLLQPKGLAMYKWKCLTTTYVDDRAYAWCCHASSGEVFCLWGDGNHRSQPLPSGVGEVSVLSGSDRALWALTDIGGLYLLKGITSNTPMGQRWIQIKEPSNVHLQSISASNERIWAVDKDGEVYWCDMSSIKEGDSSRGLHHRMGSTVKLICTASWNSLNASKEEKIRPPSEGIRCVSGCLNWNGQLGQTLLWAIGCKNSLFALGSNNEKNSLCWNFVPSPQAESITVTNGNVWILSLETHQIYVRCRLSMPERPEGEFWLHIPSPAQDNDPPELGIAELSVTPSNEAWIISENPRRCLLRHDAYMLNMSAARTSMYDIDDETTKEKDIVSENNTFTLKIPPMRRQTSSPSKMISPTEVDEDDWELLNENS